VTSLFCGNKPQQHQKVVHALRLAAERGDVAAIAALLDGSVEMVTDGGGRAPADARLVRGAPDVARRIVHVLEHQPAELAEREINGAPGLVLRRQGAVSAVVCVSVRHRRVTDLWVVFNPDKLLHWNRPAH